MMGLGLPDFIVTSFKYVGNMATPLSLIVIGIEMSTIAFQDIHWDRDIVGALIGRFIICPACVLCLCHSFPLRKCRLKFYDAGEHAGYDTNDRRRKSGRG